MRLFIIVVVLFLISIPVCIFGETEERLAADSGGVSVGYSDDEIETVPEDALIVKGNVGIGTTNPEEKLTVVNGNIKVINGNIVLGDNWLSADGDDEGLYVASDGSVGIGVKPADASFTVKSAEEVVGHVHEYKVGRYNINADALEYVSVGRCECDTSSKDEECPASFESETDYENGCDDLYWGSTKPSYMEPVYARLAKRYFKSGTKDITAAESLAIHVTKGESIFNDKVGIGKASPFEMLDVAGNIRLGEGNSIYYYREPSATDTDKIHQSWQDWRLIYIEDFESGSMGWTISGSEGGRVRGKPGSFSEYNHILRNGGTNYISRDFNVSGSAVLVKVKFNYWFIDTWDKEWGQLNVSGGQDKTLRTITVWRQQGYSEVGNSDEFGRANNDYFKTAEVIFPFEANEYDGAFELSFRSELDEGIDEESFGIDNVEVWLRPVQGIK